MDSRLETSFPDRLVIDLDVARPFWCRPALIFTVLLLEASLTGKSSSCLYFLAKVRDDCHLWLCHCMFIQEGSNLSLELRIGVGLNWDTQCPCKDGQGQH